MIEFFGHYLEFLNKWIFFDNNQKNSIIESMVEIELLLIGQLKA
jgi:hypothetical protein